MGGHERKWLHGHAKWKNCKETVELSELKGLECTVGVDLSAKIDLTSISFEFKKDDKYIVLSHSFMPEDTLAEKRQTDKVPYDLWVQQKWITTTPGAVVDYEYIKTHIRNMEKIINLRLKKYVRILERNAIHARHGSGRIYDDRDTPRDGNFIRPYKRF